MVRVEQAVILGAGGTAQAALAPCASWVTRARDAGCPVVSGLAVLLYRAVAQVELMTGHPGPVAAMRAALVGAVAARRS